VKPRIGFIGAGWWSATTHAPAVAQSHFAVAAGVVDPARDRAEMFGTRFDCPVYPDAETLLRDGALDGVVVATPHATHAPLTRLAIEHGVGVLVEKPAALTTADAIRIRDLAAVRGVPVVVSHPYLFHPHARIVRDVLRSGRLGDLVSVTGSFDSVVAHLIRGAVNDGPARDYQGFAPRAGTYSDPELSGGGQGQTQLGHLVSLLVGELDRDITDVAARMAWQEPPMDLAVAASAATDGAAIALSSTGTIQKWDDRSAWLRYTGTQGWVLHDALNGRVTGSHGVLDGVSLATSIDAYPSTAPVETLIELLRGVRVPGDVLADLENAVRTVEFVETCYSSALAVSRSALP
jgi:predicted dehydrogenase